MLYGLRSRGWDKDLLARFGLTTQNLCLVKPSNSIFGRSAVLGYRVPITGILGDQQAALYGHGCDDEYGAKCTFGTGAFLLTNTGEKIVFSKSGLLTTVAWAISQPGGVDYSYALEGSVFIAGALIQWLKDGIKLIGQYSDVERRAKAVSDSGGVVVVPAFVGLGAPHWTTRPAARFLASPEIVVAITSFAHLSKQWRTRWQICSNLASLNTCVNFELMVA